MKAEKVLRDKKRNVSLKVKKNEINKRNQILREKNLKKEHIHLNDIGKVLGLSEKRLWWQFCKKMKLHQSIL